MNGDRLPTLSARPRSLAIAGMGLLACVLIILPLAALQAQPLALERYNSSARAPEFIAATLTSPLNDAVLDSAPGLLSLQFPQRVRLVKLTLRNNRRDWVDINFRYSPQLQERFELALPSLVAASYYTAEWAILDQRDQLVRGSFSFAFGESASRPSQLKAAEARLLQQRYGDPEIRYVQPPRTRIILDQDEPRVDPPFTITLPAKPPAPQ